MNENQDTEEIFFVNKINEIEICENTFIEFTGTSFRKPTDFIREINDEHNLENCEGCNKNYNKLLVRLENRNKAFPYCCNYHSKLATQSWFNINDYTNVASFTSNKIFYSWHFILKSLDEKEWDSLIFDYIHYIIHTFGSFPEGYGEPLFLSTYFESLKDLLNNLKDKKYENKKNAIIDYLNNYSSKNKTKRNTDLNILLYIYNLWYKTFPFDISIFKHLKEKFSKNIPILESTHYNKYLDVTIAIPKTKHLLISQLERLSNQILTEINSLKLYELGKLSDFENYNLELIIKKRKLKLQKGYTNDSKNYDTRFRKILKEWLKDESNFIKELSPTVTNITKEKENIFRDILYACNKLQENKIFTKQDENGRTKQILDILELKYHTKDQSQIGHSTSGKKPGSVDGIIINKNNIEHFIEALNLKHLDKNYIDLHIHKLEQNYDYKGLINKFIIIYCNVGDDKFDVFYQKYLEYINKDINFIFKRLDTEFLETSYTNQRVFKTIHLRETINVNIYHILLKM